VNFLLDSNVLSDIGNSRPWAPVLVAKVALYGEHRCFVSAVSYAEMLAGLAIGVGRLSKKKAADLAAIYESFEILSFTRAAAVEFAGIRAAIKGKAPPVLDSMIAGRAKADGLILVTADAKDYGRMPGLHWVNWRPAV
jgi:tRNA(fMet)-specific endonuclease VapC